MKKYLVLALLCLVSVSALANTKITQMPAAPGGGGAQSGDLLPIVRTGTNYKATFPAPGAAPAGPAGAVQFYATSNSFEGKLSPAAMTAISSGIFVDPRDVQFGSNTCTGYYGIATSTLIAGGTGYAVNDTFEIASALYSMNRAVGQVTGVGGSGNVTSYVITSAGGGYNQALGNTKTTAATSGVGTGLTIRVDTASTGGNDDTLALHNALVYAQARGGAVLVPNGCWVANLIVPSGATLLGMGFGPAYAATEFTTGSTLPVMFVIGNPTYAINMNGGFDQSFVGFEINGWNGGPSPNVCLGGDQDTGSFNGAHDWIYKMSMHGCQISVGQQASATGHLLLVVQDSDLGQTASSGARAGMQGNFSDTIIIHNVFAGDGGGTGIRCGGAADACYGGMRIELNRFEFQKYGIIFDTAGGALISSNQFDHHVYCQIQYLQGSGHTLVTGNAFLSGGLGGTLIVTGAANNGSGAIRLTVSSSVNSISGWSTATSAVSTGDIATVSGVTGTTEANGVWTLTVVDGTHVDLQGSTFSSAYVSGGVAGVKGKDASICAANNNATAGNGSGNTFVNNQWNENGGQHALPAYVFEQTTTGSYSDYTMFFGGEAFPRASAQGNALDDGYRVNFDHWTNGIAPHYTLQGISGTPPYASNSDNMGYTILGGAPTVSSGAGACGTSAAIAGTNMNFRVTVGSSTNGGNCPVSFSQAWPNAPVCNCRDETSGAIGVQSLSVTTTSFIPTAYALGVTTTFGAADSLGCQCGGY